MWQIQINADGVREAVYPYRGWSIKKYAKQYCIVFNKHGLYVSSMHATFENAKHAIDHDVDYKLNLLAEVV